MIPDLETYIYCIFVLSHHIKGSNDSKGIPLKCPGWFMMTFFILNRLFPSQNKNLILALRARSLTLPFFTRCDVDSSMLDQRST